MRRSTILVTLLAASVAACSSESPLPSTSPMSHPGSLLLSDLAETGNAQALAGLRQLTAKFHDLDAAKGAGYQLLTAPPATAPDGCISDEAAGGMGYHYTRGDNLADDSITLLDPEFLVYAPIDAPRMDGVAKTRLAAIEYFIPFSAKWPGPTDPAFVKAPTLRDFATTSTLPDVAFTPTPRFGGWMFHIWLWENNPGGMFENFNASVPLCVGSSF